MWHILAFVFISLPLVLGANIPMAPQITNLVCNPREAVISWKPHNGALVKSYTIEYSTSYEPNHWSVADQKQSPENSATLKLSPGVGFTFRILSVGEHGISQPSKPSEVCTSQADIPYRNPDDAKIISLQPLEMTIKWTPIPQIEHNGPGFYYIVSWKPRDGSSSGWSVHIKDWTQDTYVIKCDKFKIFEFQVRSANQVGPSKAPTELRAAYPGEDRPSQAPRKFKIVSNTDNVYGENATVTFEWERIDLSNDALNGNAESYIIQYWSDADVDDKMDHSVGRKSKTTISGLKYNSFYSAHIQVVNNKHRGPTSKIIKFHTLEGVSKKVNSFKAISMGSSAFLLNWTKPEQPNGQLLGYNIYYEIEGAKGYARKPQITNPSVTQAILGGLKPNATYRLHIAAVTRRGEGEDSHIVLDTLSPAQPDVPSFTWEPLESTTNETSVRVNWIPKLNGNPGSSFRVLYRMDEKSNWTETEEVINHNSIIVTGLLQNQAYEMAVVSIDGQFLAQSEVQILKTNEDESSNTSMIISISVVLIVSALFSICVFTACKKRYQNTNNP
ncbi:neuroglian-like [Sitodiplosis mosellana]|uniref:neuroglian-like n=1 Tax=Sitodiplosis mosellana TaxID=263140 RepID=UPI0024445959|nr:neuroglian-like [Sitodiplosis mosellana]